MTSGQFDCIRKSLVLEALILELSIDFQCDLVCNGGFVHSDSGKPFARCHLNPRKQDETWFPNPKRISGYAQCIPDIAETCDSFPSYKDMQFFLLNNEQVTGHDGYSDDDLPELQAMFSGNDLESLYEHPLNGLKRLHRCW